MTKTAEQPSSLERIVGSRPATSTRNGSAWPLPALQVGVVGLGQMGGAFARNLLGDGLRVLAFDRDPARLSALEKHGAWAAAGYGGKILEERYSPPGRTVPLAVKDLRLARAAAEHEAVPTPAASLVHDRPVGVMARGWDWSALGLLAARDAGLTSKFLESKHPEPKS